MGSRCEGFESASSHGVEAISVAPRIAISTTEYQPLTYRVPETVYRYSFEAHAANSMIESRR